MGSRFVWPDWVLDSSLEAGCRLEMEGQINSLPYAIIELVAKTRSYKYIFQFLGAIIVAKHTTNWPSWLWKFSLNIR